LNFGDNMNGNNPSNKNKRLAFIFSGATDALIGTIGLLIGLGLLPIDVTAYGLKSWHVILLGGIFFITGMAFVAYNLSRWNE